MADITLGRMDDAIVFVRETTHQDGLYNQGDQVFVRDRHTGVETPISGREARDTFRQAGINLTPGRRLDQISQEILYRNHLHSADRYLDVGNYRRALQHLGLAVARARRAGIDPDRSRISDLWSRGVENLTRIQGNLSHHRADSRSERVSRWIEGYGRFGNILSDTNFFGNVSDRMARSAVSVVYWRDELGLNPHRGTAHSG